MHDLNNINFLPDATRGAVRSITTQQLKSTNTKGIVVNTLHLLISPGPERIKELGGIHKFMSWDGLTLSDSGGFQVFSLLHSGKWEGKIDENGAIFKSPRDGKTHVLTPEKSIDIQMMLGTDILVVLDDCRKAVTTREEAEESVNRTIEWAKRCKEHYLTSYSDAEREGKMLSAVVQGANFSDLRIKCAEALTEIGFDGYNFGGYVLDDEGKLVLDQMKTVVDNTPADKFKYAMGVGKPDDIFYSAQVGYKLFDTVLPTRNARHGTLYSATATNGEMRIRNAEFATDTGPIDESCDCEACTNHSKAYIHQMIKVGEMTGMTLATIHNIRFYQRLIEKMNELGEDGITSIEYKDILKQLADAS
ncbi:MAG: tRNA guanosine(34) transglycosylase Tgt [Candidatus Dojkabacteria bacterium]|nr:MAG: tRNA guanosine(34) transglycosylase Tgt [Candidatus Dojkabacteria bacterium]